MSDDDWWNDYAYPLHAAIDETMALPDGAPKEKRLALLAERCPWLLKELPGAVPVEATQIDPEGDEVVSITGWEPVTSSNLEAIKTEPYGVAKWADGHDEEAFTLAVRFKNGAEWQYEGVPASLVAELRAADSIGSYFSANIKGKYPETKVK